MNTNIVPEIEAKLKIAADKLAQSTEEDSIVVEGLDNKTLVKAESTLGTNLEAGMLLYPFKHDGKDYLVCITKAR